jgi:WD40 repeat protein
MKTAPARSVLFALLLWIGSPGGGPAWGQTSYLEGHTEAIYAAAYSPDGALVLTGGFDKTVRIWDRASRRLLRTVADHQNVVLTIAVSRDGLQFASAGLDNTIKLYDLPLVSPLTTFAPTAACC